MSKRMKITIIASVIVIFIITILCSSNSICENQVKAEDTENYITLYSLNNNTIQVLTEEVDTYLELAWYIKPVDLIYNIKQEYIVVYKDELDFYLNNGWYLDPVTYIYNTMGTKFIIYQYELQTYLNQGYLEVNQNDMILLAKVINAEAANSTLDRQYVGAVVMNRVRHSRFPNSVSGVIYARGQYACVGNAKFNSYPPQECLDIAKQLLLGETYGVPSNVVFQAQFLQGSGLWKRVGVHYYCYI